MEQLFTIRTYKSRAVEIWSNKEFGSWEDHEYDKDHVCAILRRFGGKMQLNRDQIKRLIESGDYVLSFNDDEINGCNDPDVGRKTKKRIRKYITQLEQLIKI